MDEAGVTDHDALQTQRFVKIDRLPPGLADGTAPSLDAVLRRMLTLDGETRLQVLEQQESGGARQQIARHGGNGFLRARPQVHGDKALQRFRAEHQRTKCWRAGQIVSDAVPGRRLPGDRKLPIRIDDRRVSPAIGVREIKPRAGQPFMEEPDPPGVGACGLGLDQVGDGRRAGRHVRAIPDDLAQDMLEHARREAGPDEDIEGDVDL